MEPGPEAKTKKKVQKSSMAEAFKSIMAKKITEPGDDAPGEDVVLAKYKKKGRDLDAMNAADAEAHKKRVLKEQQRLMGRVLPSKTDYEHERSLQIIATKGVVQLFNAVEEFQSQVVKQDREEQREKVKQRTAMINSVGTDKNTGAIGFGSLIDKINSKQRKWAILEDEGSDTDGEVKVGDL